MTNIRDKLFFFIIICILISVWGFFFGLDGFFLIFLTTELTVFLILIMTYAYVYNHMSFYNKNQSPYIVVVFLLILVTPINFYPNLDVLDMYSSIYKVTSSDFFLLFVFLFKTNSLLTLIITLIIGLFSFFFILIYFSLKNMKETFYKKTASVVSLRKQSLSKQISFKSNLYMFQK